MLQPIVFLTALTAVLGEIIDFHANNGTDWQFGFDVDYERNVFLLDGKPFRYVSGSFHYFRAPRQYWRDRLRKMRAAGLNAVSTYVEWSLHQPEVDKWVWTGDADLEEFLNIAQQEDLYVLLRPGPYICAERDLGGLPYWLLSQVPDIKLRTKDTRYMSYVEPYLNTLLDKVRPYLRGNGGPIIMVQVENEYGSYFACDKEYTNRLYRIINSKVDGKALLYTTDGVSASMLRCGSVTGAYATIDFGSNVNVTKNFEVMRLYQPRGPFVNSEYYPGWLSHWQEPFQRVKTDLVTKTLNEMLALGASVNIYMFYGGTNFGYTSGANGDSNVYTPQLTSYDYDAPLTEAGDPTSKYFEIRNVIGRYLPLPNIPLPTVAPKGAYGVVSLSKVVGLLEPRGLELFTTTVLEASQPATFEALNLSHYLMLYETNVPSVANAPAVLYANVKDRALVYLDNYWTGTLSRTKSIFSIPLPRTHSQTLKLLVENQGRLNFGNQIHDFKGIWNATLSNRPLGPWTMRGFALDDMTPLQNLQSTATAHGTLENGPIFLRGKFTISDKPLDTYLDTTGWGKGVAFINGHNLGRYWPTAGPQLTLYVPATFLKTGQNELIVLELEYVANTMKMKFRNTPLLDGPITPL